STRQLGMRAWHVEPALWDIIGKAAGLPVFRLLGGARTRVRAYASTGELRSGEQRAEDVAARVEEGFTAVKLRVRFMTVEEDVAVVRTVREAHPDVTLMVDANMGWRTHGFAEYPEWDLARATRFARELEDLNVAWLEEPLDQFDYRGYAELRRRTSVPLAAGEMLSDLHGFRDMVEHRAVDVLQPDAILSGGILMSRKIAGMAEAAGIGFSPHTWTNGVGLRVNMQVMGATTGNVWCEYPIDPPGWIPEVRDAMLTEPTTVDPDGFVTIPDVPGLGIELDEDALGKHGEEV
ncbi:MAG TPA: mandelate racemase/muconate lactonizing enzyme family protein, partial [Actinomycetota bacterium]|nr:mandelate racemase/muconate lactonizing enzyme family protein [Actinomycetota bacterium]